MDGFFGIGLWEGLLILVVILALLGPRKLPEIASRLGNFYRRLKMASRELSTELTREVEGKPRDKDESALEGLKKAASELKESLTREPEEQEARGGEGGEGLETKA